MSGGRGHRLPLAVLLAAALLAVQPVARAYLPFGVSLDGRTVPLRWEAPVRWFVRDAGTAEVTASALQASLARAFDTWQAVPTASVAFAFAGFTAAAPLDDDGISVLGFRDEPGLERVLGATSLLVDTLTGEILEADVFFNTTFAWSTAPEGEPQRFDLDSVAVHEIGHLIGLGHSAIGETELLPDGRRRVVASGTVMFPISFGVGRTLDRRLQPDDVAGVSDLYPAPGFAASTGVAQGRVTRDGVPVYGAHVVLVHLETGEMVGGFSLAGGEFVVAGLRPGLHAIRIEPLDDALPASFLDDSARVDVDFPVSFHPRLVSVPSGGAGPRIELTVGRRAS